MKTVRYCAKCESKPVPRGIRFCIECAREINDIMENPMKHAEAALCLVNATGYGNSGKLRMHAFLSVFHPTMSEQRKRQIVNDA